MTPELLKFCEEIKEDIKNSYETGVTVPEAEKAAGKFLHAMMVLAEALRSSGLDARMKKSGLKAIKAAVYLEAAQKDPKKPSDVLLNALVDSSDIVQSSQDSFDTAEVDHNYLQNVYDICREGHIYMRTISKQQG